jgi:phosphodiesterase/alkaline phosphatase D-like protein
VIGLALLMATAPKVVAGQPANVAFTHGVASGDVTAHSAVLWTRADRTATLQVEVSERSDFAGPAAFKTHVTSRANNDYTAKVVARGLRPGTSYYYRFRFGNTFSPTGRFTTAPAFDASHDLRFTYSGCSDHLHDPLFAVMDRIYEEDADFFIYLGDTIYADSDLQPDSEDAQTVDEYREDYRLTRDKPSVRAVMGDVSTYALMDDHEVVNDYDGATVALARYANGRRAFFDYMPIDPAAVLHDSTCAGDPVFKTVRWGADVELFFLDERSCRSADALAECSTSGSTFDLMPTLPAPVRSAFRAGLIDFGLAEAMVDLLLPESPAAACTAALNDPGRTVLGPVQKAAFKAALKASNAPYKIIVNEYPIQEFFAIPYDRWEGYAAEREELLAFMRDEVAGEIVFVTGDTHGNLVNQVAVDTFADPLPIATELVTGPVATFTLQEELEFFASQIGVPGAALVGLFHEVLTIADVECRAIDDDSYGLVEYDADSGTLSATLKDDTGATLCSAVF